MIAGIVAGAPLWVWPLLGVLIFVGLRASRERTAPVWLVYALPLLAVLSLRAMAALAPGVPGWAMFIAAFVGGIALGLVLGRRWLLAREGDGAGGRVRLSGEWLTMVQVLAIFALNFVTGTLRVVAPQVVAGTAYPLVFALVAGVSSGIFAGRALAMALARG